MNNLSLKTVKEKNILPYINDLARLRISIFKEYPYLYDGDLTYEENYLKTYCEASESMMVIVIDQDTIVGASTGIPLKHETIECKTPFIENGFNVNDFFYFGESLLLPKYRGLGIYSQLFAAREKTAKEYGYKKACFCAVERSPDDPRKPDNYVPLNRIWEKYGYKKNENLCAYYEWKEIDESKSSLKPMIFWTKDL